MEKRGSMFLCSKSEATALIERAEREKEQLLYEFRQFYAGDIDIKLREVRHVMGISISATLTVNGDAVREYDPADLCFLDLNELILKRLLEHRRATV